MPPISVQIRNIKIIIEKVVVSEKGQGSRRIFLVRFSESTYET